MTKMTEQKVPLYQILWRGIRGRCPSCGQGKLFKSYLKQVQACEHCQHEWGHIRADDGPAWLTVLITGHVMAPFILHWLPGSSYPAWKIVAGISVPLVLLILLILPRAKGFFIGMIWRVGCSGAEK